MTITTNSHMTIVSYDHRIIAIIDYCPLSLYIAIGYFFEIFLLWLGEKEKKWNSFTFST